MSAHHLLARHPLEQTDIILVHQEKEVIAPSTSEHDRADDV